MGLILHPQITNGGSPVFLKSPIISISALDNEGNPVASPSSTWHDDSKKSSKSKGKVSFFSPYFSIISFQFQ